MSDAENQDPARLRDRERTRSRILEAAKVAFSKVGYPKASIRDIAADAGITAALVVRYFGSKESLFEAAVANAFDLGEAFATTPRDQLGKAMADMLFSEPQDVDLTAMMLLAATDPTISPHARRIAHARMLQPMARMIGGPNADHRAAMVLAVATGLWFYRFKLPLKPLAGRVDPSVVDEVAAILQGLIDTTD